MSPSLVPSLDNKVHLVLCDFGRYGKSYMETDPAEADEATIVRNMIDGQYGSPISVVAFNPIEGWACDVSKDIALAVSNTSERYGISLPEGTQAFVESQRSSGRPKTAALDYRDVALGIRMIREAVEQTFGLGVEPHPGVTILEECEAIARAIYRAAERPGALRPGALQSGGMNRPEI
jgi:hypothetical protein